MNTRGGKREGAGRKELPASEKKIALQIYLKRCYIDKVGRKKLQDKIYKLLQV